jgi:hypothetical protein
VEIVLFIQILKFLLVSVNHNGEKELQKQLLRLEMETFMELRKHIGKMVIWMKNCCM